MYNNITEEIVKDCRLSLIDSMEGILAVEHKPLQYKVGDVTIKVNNELELHIKKRGLMVPYHLDVRLPLPFYVTDALFTTEVIRSMLDYAEKEDASAIHNLFNQLEKEHNPARLDDPFAYDDLPF